ncbi:hypothetical protein LW131_10000 [Riemerella anatipestifer]|nr:hypothetical protein [Riemerella anatipestifer]
MKIYNEYKKTSNDLPHVIFGGSMAEYRYYDMHQIIGSALSRVEKIPPKNS